MLEHSSESNPTSPQWSVYRIDDTGNVFLVRAHLDLDEAEHLVTQFTARGHKQMYWVEQEDDNER